MGAIDDEPAWIDAARFLTKVWRHPTTHSTLFISACTCVLTAAALHTGTYYTPTADVIVYCLIYSLWLTICLPWLVKNLDKRTLLLVTGVLLRLVAAEAGVLAWGVIRGHGHFLQRALRLRPLLEPSLMWLSEAGYNLRYGVIVASVVAAVLSTLTDLVQKYGHMNSNNRCAGCIKTSAGGEDMATQTQPKQNCVSTALVTGMSGCPANEHAQVLWPEIETFPAASAGDCWCCKQHAHECLVWGPERGVTEHTLLSRSPHKSERKRKPPSLRSFESTNMGKELEGDHYYEAEIQNASAGCGAVSGGACGAVGGGGGGRCSQEIRNLRAGSQEDSLAAFERAPTFTVEGSETESRRRSDYGMRWESHSQFQGQCQALGRCQDQGPCRSQGQCQDQIQCRSQCRYQDQCRCQSQGHSPNQSLRKSPGKGAMLKDEEDDDDHLNLMATGGASSSSAAVAASPAAVHQGKSVARPSSSCGSSVATDLDPKEQQTPGSRQGRRRSWGGHQSRPGDFRSCPCPVNRNQTLPGGNFNTVGNRKRGTCSLAADRRAGRLREAGAQTSSPDRIRDSGQAPGVRSGGDFLKAPEPYWSQREKEPALQQEGAHMGRVSSSIARRDGDRTSGIPATGGVVGSARDDKRETRRSPPRPDLGGDTAF